MGTNQSAENSSSFIELKRQSHPIMGQITLIKQQCSPKIFHKKLLRQSPSFPPKTLLSQNQSTKQIKPFIQIHHISNQSSMLMVCASEQTCTVVIDSVEVDLQSIQNSSFFHGFTQDHLLNIMCNVLEAIVVLNGSKLGVFPISAKTVFLSGIQEYKGQDLSKVTFKVLPVQLIKPQNIKQYQNSLIIPPEHFETFHFFKQQLYLSFSPKSHIYSLGVMILNFIFAQENKAVDISFGNLSLSIQNTESTSTQNKKSQKGSHEIANMLSVLEFSPNFSLQFKKIVQQMVKIQEQSRIGLTCLFDQVKRAKTKTFQQKNKQDFSKTQKKDQNKEQMFKKRRSKRTMSGLQFTSPKLHSQQKLIENQILKIENNNMHPLRERNFIKSAKEKKVTNSEPLKTSENVPIFHSERIKFQNGAIYDGQVDDKNNFNGFGTLYYNEKNICYTGYWRNNRFHGFGYLFNNKKYQRSQTFKEGEIGSDCFGAGNHKDQGQIAWERYEGEFLNDLKHGYGILYFIDGTKFQGQFIEGKAHGSGNFTNKNKETVNGLWHNNKLIKQYQ